MKPTDFPQSNTKLLPPSGEEDNIDRMQVHITEFDGKPCAISRWEPSEKERQAIADGAPIWLYVFGRAHPPVALMAAKNVFSEPETNGQWPDVNG